jgi:hypothetical protein
MERPLKPKRPLKSKRPYLCEYQQLAWLAWKTDEAIIAFSGSGARSARLWAQARFGIFPPELGRPTIRPNEAEEELDRTLPTFCRPPALKR